MRVIDLLSRKNQAVFSLCLLTTVFLAASCSRHTPADTKQVLPNTPLPDGAQVVSAESRLTPVRVDLVGTVTPASLVKISARIPAHVSKVFVSAGQAVTAADLLLTLDDREIQEQSAATEAQLKQAEAEYKRARQLYETRATTEQALTAAESMFHAAQAQFQRMKVMLSYTQIASPIDGIVTDRRVEAGDIASPGQLLMAVYNPENMRLEVPVPVRLIERLQLNQKVELTLERPAKKFQGSVVEIVAEIDPMTRTQLVRIKIENHDSKLLPGTFGRLWVNAEERQQVMVPADAVQRSGQLEFVYVAQDGLMRQRLVKTGARHDNRFVVLSGLNAGDMVVKITQEGSADE